MRKILSLLLLAGFVGTGAAQASTIGAVGSPDVAKGKTVAEARIGYSETGSPSSQDERLRMRAHIDHGFTNIYALRFGAALDKRKNDGFELDSIGIENRLHLLDRAQYDLGLRFGYTFKDGDKKPDSISFGFYERLSPENWDIRLNQLFKHETGQGRTNGLLFESRIQVTKSWTGGKHRFGVELFDDFGNLSDQSGYSDQSHTIGPVFKGTMENGLSYETGYRTGISRGAPDHSFKIIVSKGF